MKNFNLFNLKSIVRSKARWLLTLITLLTLNVGQMWAYDAHFYLIGSWNNWSATDKNYKLDYDDGDSKYSIYWYMNQNTYFALNNGSTGYRPTTTTNVYSGHSGTSGKYTSDDGGCSDCSWQYTGNAGIVKIRVDENSKDKEWRPWVWVERPTIVIKHDFSRSGGDWQYQNMTDNNDGTYQYIGTYSGGGANVGPQYVEKYFESPTLVGAMAGDRCIFVYDATGYQEKSTNNTRNSTANTGTLTITKLCTITYNANGATNGTVPSNQEDILYNTATTVQSNSGSLVRTGYIFAGWNTQADGNGTTYAAGSGTINPTDASTTLYAKWTPITVTATVTPSTGAPGMQNLTFTISTNAPQSANYYCKIYGFGTVNSGSANTGANLNGDWQITSSNYNNYQTTINNVSLPSVGSYTTQVVITKDAIVEASSDPITFTAVSGPSVALALSSASTDVGTSVTLTATASNAAGSKTYSFYEGETLLTTTSSTTENSASYTYTPSTYTATKTLKVVMNYSSTNYNSSNQTLTINTPTFSSFGTSATYGDEGGTLTLSPTPTHNNSVTPTYEYSTTTTFASTTAIASTSWTLPADEEDHATQTLYVRAKMTVGGYTAYSDYVTVTVYGKKTIRIKNAQNWETFNVYTWGGVGNRWNVEWPGGSTNLSRVGTSQWYNLTIYSDVTGWIVCNGVTSNPGVHKITDQTSYASFEDGGCYAVTSTLKQDGSSGNADYIHYFSSDASEGSHTKSNVTCPSAPSVTTAAASSIAATSAVFNASDVANGNDAITAYGFKWGTTDACSSGTVPASNLGSGTTFSATKSSLTNGTTYYYKAYATNGQGTTYGDVQSFRTKFVTTVTLDQQGGSDGTSEVSATEGSTMPNGKTAPSKTGYTFGGYYKNEGGSGTQYYNATMASAHTWDVAASTATIYAKWTAIHYPITYELNGGNNTGIVPWNPATYTIEQNVNITVSPNKTGYDFSGWYSDNGLTTPITTPAISIGTTGNKTFYAKWTPKTYTVTFDAATNGGTCGTASKTVTFNAAYGELPVATKPAKEFVGWYTTDSDSPTPGTRVTAETIVSTADDHTLFARFEDTYEVTVAYKCGEVTLYPSTKVTASASSLTPEITAPEILGYTFSNWTGTNVTPAEASSATTTITATASTTITANYTAVPTVYFKNNLGWENVYVTFDAYFDGSRDNAPGNYGKPYFQMTQIGSSDVYYCVIPSRYTTSDYASWAWNIAFDNTGFSASANQGTKTGAFDRGEFTGRGDFDPKATMFIPYDGDTETRNSGTYYRTGCWMKYNSTDPGYSVKVNTIVTGENADALTVNLTADVAGGFEFRGKADLESSNYTYGFKLYKDYLKNNTDIYYSNSGEIWATTTTLPWDFSTKVNGEAVTANSQRCGLHTEALGEYEFIVSFGTGRPVVDVVYPVSVGDWRLVYKDLATWSGEAHTASWSHPSRVIKAKASTEDIVSFYVAYGHSPSIELQKCTAINASTGAQTWTKQSDVSLSSITATGIYNFKVSQNESKVATVTFDGGYTGNFYIRTDASDGGWSNYKTSGTNTMTYSEYAESQTADKRFSHYFMRHVNKGQNIKFCIANDYSECISDTLVDDTYASEWIGNEANIRFMWYHATNKISRAYLSGSTIVSDRFLVLEGDDKMFDANGAALNISGLNANEINFDDDQNWIYEATVQAQPLARIKLTAKFADKIQYFYGTEETTEELIGGSGTDKYTLRIVYDFKTNRLIKALMPSGEITTDMAIKTDLMIIREHQGDAQQILFSGSGKLSDVKTVYGAMKFNKWTVNNKEKADGHAGAGLSNYERDLFWISFPFEVKLGEVFGFGTYGKHWIIEYYDGKGRAENGFWADSPTNWKFVTPQMKNTFILKANQGYVLALDLEEMTEESSIWNNGVEDVYLYFPSSATVKDIRSTSKQVDIDQDGYQCTINRPYGSDGDRRVKDSYWHVIGVPSYANYNNALTNEFGGTTIDWRSTSMPFLYEWNPNTNALSITSSATFNFKAMHSYLVQYSGASIYWSAINATPSSVAARTMRQADCNLQVELLQGENVEDKTLLRMTEDEAVTNAFEFNYDLCKENNKNRSNIWTITSDNLPVAGNSLPFSDETIIIPVGVSIASNGEYTLAMPEVSDDISVVIIDNEYGTRTDLRLMDYDVNLTAGTYSDRFMLEIRTSRGAATDIEGIEGGTIKDGKAHKFVRDGIMYILRDGVIYDAMGKRVK